MTTSQVTGERRVLNYLIKKTYDTPSYGTPKHSITNLVAIRQLGTTSLATYIMRLKRKGYVITSKWIKVINMFGEPCHVKCYTLDVTQLPECHRAYVRNNSLIQKGE